MKYILVIFLNCTLALFGIDISEIPTLKSTMLTPGYVPRSSLGNIHTTLEEMNLKSKTPSSTGKTNKIEMRELTSTDRQEITSALNDAVFYLVNSSPYAIKTSCAVLKFMKENGLYYFKFFKALDEAIVIQHNQYSPYWEDHGRDNDQLLDTFHYSTTFFNMLYLGYCPTDKLQIVMLSVCQQIQDNFDYTHRVEKDPDRLYHKAYEKPDPNYQAVFDYLKPQDELGLIVIAYAMMSNCANKKTSCLDEQTKTFALNRMKYFLDYFSKQKIDFEKRDLFYGFVKQMLYWSLFLEVSNCENALTVLNQCFRGYRFSNEHISDSGAEFRFRGVILNKMQNCGRLSNVNFAANPSFSPLKTNVDFTFWDQNSLVFFEVDGPFHFVRVVIDNEYKPRLNGQTFLKTLLLMQYGKVLRVSTKCADDIFERRVSNVAVYVNNLMRSQDQLLLVDPENYTSLKNYGYPVKSSQKIKTDKAVIMEEARKRTNENIMAVRKRAN